MTDPTSGRSPVERSPSTPGGRSAPADTDPATEVARLADLLAEVVRLTRQRAVYPGRWEHLAELALEHPSVRAALRTEETRTPPPLCTGHIIAQLNELRDLLGDD